MLSISVVIWSQINVSTPENTKELKLYFLRNTSSQKTWSLNVLSFILYLESNQYIVFCLEGHD